jgi:hypothetical protein
MTQPYGIADAGDPAPKHPHGDERPVGEIVNDLWEKAETLARQEIKLGLTEAEEKVTALKAELKEDVDKLKLELFAKLIGGATVFTGVLALGAALILLLSEAMDPWLAALIVGLAIGGLGVALLKRDVELPDGPDPKAMVPQRTIRNVRADAKAIEEASHDATS